MGQTALGQYVDQLAQSFTVSEQYGVYVTKIGVFFQSVSSVFPISLHLRDGRGVLATSVKTASEMSSAASATAATETTFLLMNHMFLPQGSYIIFHLKVMIKMNIMYGMLSSVSLNLVLLKKEL